MTRQTCVETAKQWRGGGGGRERGKVTSLPYVCACVFFCFFLRKDEKGWQRPIKALHPPHPPHTYGQFKGLVEWPVCVGGVLVGENSRCRRPYVVD